jgi:large conductance mechanosensitive channel
MLRESGCSSSWRRQVSSFKAFLLRTNALALAVGVILGLALSDVIKSLVNDIIMPPIGLALGNLDFSQLKIVLKAATGGDATTEVAIRYGTFINVVITFVIVALVVYVITEMMRRPRSASTARKPSRPMPRNAAPARAPSSAALKRALDSALGRADRRVT